VLTGVPSRAEGIALPVVMGNAKIAKVAKFSQADAVWARPGLARSRRV